MTCRGADPWGKNARVERVEATELRDRVTVGRGRAILRPEERKPRMPAASAQPDGDVQLPKEC